MVFKSRTLLVFVVLVITTACGPSHSAIAAEDSPQLGEKINEIGAYGIYSFYEGDDQCFVATDESIGSIDAVSLSCDFGDNREATDHPQVLVGIVGNYSIYYLVFGDNECYVATDQGIGSIDAVDIDCSDAKGAK